MKFFMYSPSYSKIAPKTMKLSSRKQQLTFPQKQKTRMKKSHVILISIVLIIFLLIFILTSSSSLFSNPDDDLHHRRHRHHNHHDLKVARRASEVILEQQQEATQKSVKITKENQFQLQTQVTTKQSHRSSSSSSSSSLKRHPRDIFCDSFICCSYYKYIRDCSCDRWNSGGICFLGNVDEVDGAEGVNQEEQSEEHNNSSKKNETFFVMGRCAENGKCFKSFRPIPKVFQASLSSSDSDSDVSLQELCSTKEKAEQQQDYLETSDVETEERLRKEAKMKKNKNNENDDKTKKEVPSNSYRCRVSHYPSSTISSFRSFNSNWTEELELQRKNAKNEKQKTNYADKKNFAFPRDRVRVYCRLEAFYGISNVHLSLAACLALAFEIGVSHVVLPKYLDHKHLNAQPLDSVFDFPFLKQVAGETAGLKLSLMSSVGGRATTSSTPSTSSTKVHQNHNHDENEDENENYSSPPDICQDLAWSADADFHHFSECCIIDAVRLTSGTCPAMLLKTAVSFAEWKNNNNNNNNNKKKSVIIPSKRSVVNNVFCVDELVELLEQFYSIERNRNRNLSPTFLQFNRFSRQSRSVMTPKQLAKEFLLLPLVSSSSSSVPFSRNTSSPEIDFVTPSDLSHSTLFQPLPESDSQIKFFLETIEKQETSIRKTLTVLSGMGIQDADRNNHLQLILEKEDVEEEEEERETKQEKKETKNFKNKVVVKPQVTLLDSIKARGAIIERLNDRFVEAENRREWNILASLSYFNQKKRDLLLEEQDAKKENKTSKKRLMIQNDEDLLSLRFKLEMFFLRFDESKMKEIPRLVKEYFPYRIPELLESLKMKWKQKFGDHEPLPFLFDTQESERAEEDRQKKQFGYLHDKRKNNNKKITPEEKKEQQQEEEKKNDGKEKVPDSSFFPPSKNNRHRVKLYELKSELEFLHQQLKLATVNYEKSTEERLKLQQQQQQRYSQKKEDNSIDSKLRLRVFDRCALPLDEYEKELVNKKKNKLKLLSSTNSKINKNNKSQQQRRRPRFNSVEKNLLLRIVGTHFVGFNEFRQGSYLKTLDWLRPSEKVRNLVQDAQKIILNSLSSPSPSSSKSSKKKKSFLAVHLRIEPDATQSWMFHVDIPEMLSRIEKLADDFNLGAVYVTGDPFSEQRKEHDAQGERELKVAEKEYKDALESTSEENKNNRFVAKASPERIEYLFKKLNETRNRYLVLNDNSSSILSNIILGSSSVNNNENKKKNTFRDYESRIKSGSGGVSSSNTRRSRRGSNNMITRSTFKAPGFGLEVKRPWFCSYDFFAQLRKGRQNQHSSYRHLISMLDRTMVETAPVALVWSPLVGFSSFSQRIYDYRCRFKNSPLPTFSYQQGNDDKSFTLEC